MAAATGNQTLYGFIYWLKGNPFKSIEAGMTHADLDAMVLEYVTVNETDGTLTAADPASYGATQDFPKHDNTGGTTQDGLWTLQCVRMNRPSLAHTTMCSHQQALPPLSW